MEPHWYLLLSLSALVVYVLATSITNRTRAPIYNLPPLVPGVPLFGNTFQIPLVQQGPWAKKLAEKYGEM
jgi:hypothetical protein